MIRSRNVNPFSHSQNAFSLVDVILLDNLTIENEYIIAKLYKNGTVNSIILKENNKFISVVAQTTFDTKEWKKCIKKIKNLCTNQKIFDTICNATSVRQNEADLIAGRSDFMIVIGDRHSSNTNLILHWFRMQKI